MPNRSIPFRSAELITPDDDVSFPSTRGYRVTVGGDVRVQPVENPDGSLTPTPIPIVIPGALPGIDYGGTFTKLLATGTTATGIILLR